MDIDHHSAGVSGEKFRGPRVTEPDPEGLETVYGNGTGNETLPYKPASRFVPPSRARTLPTTYEESQLSIAPPPPYTMETIISQPQRKEYSSWSREPRRRIAERKYSDDERPYSPPRHRRTEEQTNKDRRDSERRRHDHESRGQSRRAETDRRTESSEKSTQDNHKNHKHGHRHRGSPEPDRRLYETSNQGGYGSYGFMRSDSPERY